MPFVKFILFAICLVVISAIISYSAYRRFNAKIFRFGPLIIFFAGTIYFGIGPFIFNYAQGVSLGLFYLYLGIFFGIAFISSLGTLIYFKIKK